MHNYRGPVVSSHEQAKPPALCLCFFIYAIAYISTKFWHVIMDFCSPGDYNKIRDGLLEHNIADPEGQFSP